MCLVFLFCPMKTYSATIQLYVGETGRLDAPNAVSDNGFIDNAVVLESDRNLLVDTSDPIDVKVTVVGYFSNSATVKIRYVEKYTYNGHVDKVDHDVEYKITTKYPTIKAVDNNITISIGEKRKLEYTVTPSGLLPPPMNWGTIDYYGYSLGYIDMENDGYDCYVTGKKEGKAVVAALPFGVQSMGFVYIITVVGSQKPKLTLSASPSGGQVKSGTIVTLAAKANGSTVSGCDIYFTTNGSEPSRNNGTKYSSGITISNNCTLKAIAYKDGYEASNVLTKNYTVKDEPVTPTNISVSPSSKTIKVGDTFYCNYTLSPSNATTTVTWSSDNTNIATVSSSGVVKGIKAGTTKIRVKTSNGLSDYCNVTVEESQDEWRDGDIFTAQTIEGVEMTFQVISAKNRTCGVGISEASNDDCSSAIDTTYVGIVTIPKIIRGLNVEKIHFCAFDESNLTAVNIPEGVRELGPYAFAECENLTTLLLPESLEIISRSALRGTGLTSITIPKNVSLIEIDDFEPNFLINNTSLESIVVDKQNGYYDSRNDCNAIIESATGKLISGCKNTIIPSGIKEIGAEAFYGCHSLVTIDIPEGIERIGEFAFGWCTGLLDMTMPSSLVEIDGYAFAQCRNLTMITIPKNVKSFGKNIISGCNNIRSIHSLMMAPTAIDVETIFGNVCYRTVLYVPKDAKEQYRAKEGWNRFKWITSEAHENDGKTFTVKTVEGVDMTFCILSETEKICQVADFVIWDAENNATSKRCVPYATEGVVTIPTKANGYEVVRVNDLAFLNCKWITSVILPSSIAYIGKYALQGCSALEKIEVPNSVESIDEYAFSKCEKLTEAKLPDELTKLESALFWSDKSLSSITLPRTIKDIEYSVFSECESLSEIHAGMIEPCYLPTGSFDDDVYNSATLYVPAGTTDLYKSSRKGSWYRFKHIEEENGNSIADVTMGKKESTQIYKLSGQRVTNPRKGIYIKGGKKVLVR